MRLTEKWSGGYDIANRQKKRGYTDTELYDAFQKLGKLEDIMDKYGISNVEQLEQVIFEHSENKYHACEEKELNAFIWDKYVALIKFDRNEIGIAEIIKDKGLTRLHQGLIRSTTNYNEYRIEFNLASDRWFICDFLLTENEYKLVKDVLLKL